MEPAEARHAINRLMNAYCYLIDAGDIEGFSRLFAHGSWGVAGEPGGPAVGTEAVMARLTNVILYDGVPRTKHVMSNLTNELDSDTRARASCYITVMQAVPPELPLQPIFIGRYDDELACVDGDWRFISREIQPDLIGEMRFHRRDMA